MPYVSNNYRFEEKSKLKGLMDAFFFVTFSTVAILLILFVLGWASSGDVQASPGINQQLNYQGRINTALGLAVANGTYNIKLAIYDVSAGGTCLWTAVGSCADGNIATTTVSVVNGVFSIALGDTGQNSLATSTIDWNSNELYLGVAVRGTAATPVYDDEMSPRKRLTSSPYAFNANAVNGIHATSTAAVANYLMALDANKVLNLYDGGVSTTYATSTQLYINSNISVGTSTVKNMLFVVDDDVNRAVNNIAAQIEKKTTLTGNSGVSIASGVFLNDIDPNNFNYTGSAAALYSIGRVIGSSVGSSLNNLFGFTTRIENQSPSTLTDAYALSIRSTTNTGGGTITNNYGLYVESQTAGINNYQIYSAGTAPSYFAGAIGIGTLTPNYKLVVKSNNSTDNLFQVASTTNQGIFVVNSNGRVGIGTSTPQSRFFIQGSDFNDATIFMYSDNESIPSYFGVMSGANYSNAYNERFLFGKAGSDYWEPNASFLTNVSDSSFYFFQNYSSLPCYPDCSLQQDVHRDAIAFTISPQRYFGIGTTSPNSLLHVNASSTNPNFDLFKVSTTTNLTGTGHQISTHLVVRSNGQVGISTSTPWSGYELAVTGDGVYTGNLNVLGWSTTTKNLTVIGSLATGGAIPNSTTTANFGGNIYVQGNATSSGNLSVGGQLRDFTSIMMLGGSVNADYGVSLGYLAQSTGANSVALGYQSLASGLRAFAVGKGTASNQDAIAIGFNSAASGENSLAIGVNSWAEGVGSFATGYQSQASGEDSMAIGRGAYASGYESIAFTKSSAEATSSVGFMGAQVKTPYTFGINLNGATPDIRATSTFYIANGDLYVEGNATTTGKISGGLNSRFGGDMTWVGGTQNNYWAFEEYLYDNAIPMPMLKAYSNSLPVQVPGASPYIGAMYGGLYLTESDATGKTAGNVNWGFPNLTFVDQDGDSDSIYFNTTTNSIIFPNSPIFEKGLIVGTSTSPIITINDSGKIGMGAYTAPVEFLGVMPSSQLGEYDTAHFKTWQNLSQLFLASDGDVGIATSTPWNGYKLAVDGSIVVTGDIAKNGTNYNNPSYVFDCYYSNSCGDYQFTSFQDAVDYMKLNNHLINLPDIDGVYSLEERQRLHTEKLEEIMIYLDEFNLNRNYFTDNVGIGTTTPGGTFGEKLTVVGDSYFQGNATTTGNFSLPNIEIGTFDAVNIDGSGRLTKVSSSRRYKSDIDYNGIDGNLVYQLQPASYTENATGKELLGFIAEDVALVEPRLVIYDEQGRPDSLYYPNFTALLAKAIQDQKKEIDDLKVQIGAGSAVNSELKVIDDPDADIKTLVVREAANFYGTITVLGEAGFISKVTFNQDIEVKGKIYASNDQAGTATIALGATSTAIIFDKDYEVVPKVTATARIPVAIGIKDQTTKGFTAYVLEPVAQDLAFDWIVLAVKNSPAIPTPPLPAEPAVVLTEIPIVEAPLVEISPAEPPIEEILPTETPIVEVSEVETPVVEVPLIEEEGIVAGAALE